MVRPLRSTFRPSPPSFGLARLAPPLPFALASTRPLLLAVLVFHRRRRRHGRPALTSRFLDPAPSPNAAVVMPPEHVQAFHEGLGGLLARWTALQLAITNEWGGADSSKKGDEMYEELLEWFLKRKGGKHAEDLEELLIEILGDDFSVQCEDGSPREVARIACNMYEQIATGDYALARDICSKPLPREHLERSRRVEEDRRWTAGAQAQGAGGDSSGESEGEDDEPMDADDLAEGLGGFSMRADEGEEAGGERRGRPEPDEDGWCTVPTRRR